MIFDQLLQRLELCVCFFHVSDRVSRHGHRKHVASGGHAGIDLLQSLACANGLFGTAVEAVGKVVERLADRIGEGDGSVVDKCDVANTPALEISTSATSIWNYSTRRRYQ